MNDLINSFLMAPPKSSIVPPAVSQRAEMVLDRKCVFVTMLTTDSFSPGCSVLCRSLRKHNANHAIYVMLTADVSKIIVKQLGKLCDGIILVDKIESPFKETDLAGDAAVAVSKAAGGGSEGKVGGVDAVKPSWLASDMTKLRLWGLTQFDSIVYIDADCLVMRNVEELFGRDTAFAAAPDVFPPDKFNAGVLLLRPNQDVFQSMVEALAKLPSYDGGDTGFLNAFYPDWYTESAVSRLPFGFNAQRTLYWFTKDRPGYWQSIQPLSIIHYSSSPKPWQQTDKKGELEMLWWVQSFP